ALGRATGPQQERGVYRTRDGGETWERVLFVNPNTGCSGLSMDAKDPNVLFAGTWELVMHTWAMFSGGPGSGVYVSRDGGTKWTRINHPGLPKSPVGKIDVAIAHSDSKRVYALIQTANQGSLWRSDDGGVAWRVVSWDRRLIGRAGYYIRVAVNSANADEVYVMNSSSHRSNDGGLTFPQGVGGCGDCHDMWVDPINPDHWWTTGDNSAGLTRDHGRSYTSVDLPNGQMYHVAADNRVPYWIYSNRQDDGTMRGPSNSPVPVANVPSYAPASGRGGGGGGRGGGGGAGGGRGGATSTWQQGIGGCESGFTIPLPTNPDIIWASCYGNQVTRYDARQGRARSVSPWKHTLDHPPTDLKYRCHWTPPLAIDPFEEETVYYGCQVIFKTTDRGQTWTVISPDLSTNDPSRIAFSGGIIGDNLGQFYGEVVFAIAASEIQRGLIWAGTNDGQLWNTRDGGAHWTNVTKNVRGLPEWGTIRRIDPSRFDAGTAYVAVDFHMMDNRDPFVYKTTDFGQTWTKISDGLPSGHPLDYVLNVVENPNRKGMLFAGSGRAFYYSMDDGTTWTRFEDGLPAAPVTWIVPQKMYHDVVVSTYGRGLYILRDITTLEQSDKVNAAEDAHLYAPRPGIRQARNGSAEFLYSLKTAPTGPVAFEVLDLE
ncbi:MAG: WD40/YVTN/BNR-like repeat-containing protein, partial [Longimicrobiales bacterium]